jgi:hypothetical protein
MIRYIKRDTNPMTWLQESHELLEFVKAQVLQTAFFLAVILITRPPAATK